MKIIVIVAVSRDGYIGKDNKLPWHIPEELKHFRDTVRGKVMVCGRKTFESLPKSLQASPNMILMSRTQNGIDSMLKAVEVAKERGADELYVIGGAEVYKQAIPMATQLIISYIKQSVNGDVKLPDIPYTKWKVDKFIKAKEYTTIWWRPRSV